MSSKELKLFCDKYQLQFPTFNIEPIHLGLFSNVMYMCNIKWYNTIIIVTHLHNTLEDMIQEAMVLLNNWLESDLNFISLVQLSQT